MFYNEVYVLNFLVFFFVYGGDLLLSVELFDNYMWVDYLLCLGVLI